MRILGGAPTWVWVLLAVLVVIGVRRLRTREVPVAVALLPGTAFLAWSLIGAAAFARSAGAAPAIAAWIGGAAIGLASTRVIREPRATRTVGGRVRQAGSPLPLVLYLAVFAARFACGAWAAMRPEQAVAATAIGIAVGAGVTVQLLSGVAGALRPQVQYRMRA